MYLVMGITGNVGGTTRVICCSKANRCGPLRNREKAAQWADEGVELVDGDWNDATAIDDAMP